jgi:hypothetical protein
MKTFSKLLISMVSILILPFAGETAETPDSAIVYIEVGYSKDGTFIPLEDGTGFLVNAAGWVATAKHLTETPIPDNRRSEFRGSVGTRTTGNKDELFLAPGPVVSADVSLLRFSPQLRHDWPYLKILANPKFSFDDPIIAYGYPSTPQPQDLRARPGKITGLLGPNSSIEVNAGIAPGMSGGPVLLPKSSCVVGVIAGGSGYPGFDYFTPIQYARSLLEVAPAEFVTTINTQPSNKPATPQIADKIFRVDETRDTHEAFSNSSQTFDILFYAEPDTTIVSARLVEESAAAASDKRVTISPDRKTATFHFRLESGPSCDRWRGWWHGQVVLTEQTGSPAEVIQKAEQPKCS